MKQSLFKIDFNVYSDTSIVGFYSPQFIISTSTTSAVKNFIEIFEKRGYKTDIGDLKINKIVDIEDTIK